MSSYNLRRFSNVDTLKTINPASLLALLLPFKDYFSSRNVDLPAALNSDTLNYEGIVEVLMNPELDSPPDLRDCLYYVHEMATDENADDLIELLNLQGIVLPEDPTPADIAIKLWLSNPEALLKKHSEKIVEKLKTFKHFQSKNDIPVTTTIPSKESLKLLEMDLNKWFIDKKRGEGTKVLMFPKESEWWFLVGHGYFFKRDGSMEKGKESSVFYRPVKHDTIVYNSRTGEIRINACGKKEIALYLKEFGKHLFGDENFFPNQNKYTLEPLNTYGKSSLKCTDIEGIDWVKLKEIQVMWGGEHGEIEIRKADDLFSAYEKRERTLPKSNIFKASFVVKFSDSKTPRTVTIKPPNVAKYLRDDGPIVEVFLNERKFIKKFDNNNTPEEEDETDADMVNA